MIFQQWSNVNWLSISSLPILIFHQMITINYVAHAWPHKINKIRPSRYWYCQNTVTLPNHVFDPHLSMCYAGTLEFINCFTCPSAMRFYFFFLNLLSNQIWVIERDVKFARCNKSTRLGFEYDKFETALVGILMGKPSTAILGDHLAHSSQWSGCHVIVPWNNCFVSGKLLFY